MLDFDIIKLEGKSQGFTWNIFGILPEQDKTVLMVESTRTSKETHCPECGGKVHKYDSFSMTLKDMPIYYHKEHTVYCTGSRFRCQLCCKTFTEEVLFRYPGTMITCRATNRIRGFLIRKLSVRAILADMENTGQNVNNVHISSFIA